MMADEEIVRYDDMRRRKSGETGRSTIHEKDSCTAGRIRRGDLAWIDID
jgi:hypothetical protein